MAIKLIKSIVYLWILIISAMAFCDPAAAQEKPRPVVLVFQAEKAEQLGNSFASSITRAIRNYYRETNRVEATIFDRESPAVKRAILEKKITLDSIASYSTREQRVSAAKILGFEYASGTEATIETAKGIDGKLLKMKVWLVDVNGGSKAVWEASSVAVYSDTDEFALDNAMQSAASKAVIDVTSKAFSKLPITNDVEPISGDESIAVGGAKTPEIKQLESSDYSSNAEESLSEGNLAVAIQEYSRAISADPSNASLRIKLAEAYAKKKMYTEALDALDRALEVGADKNMVESARQKIESMRSGQTVTIEQPKAQKQPVQEQTSPKPTAPEPIKLNSTSAAAVAKLVEGDKLWNKGDPDGAAKSYAEAIKLNPKDWRSYERLAVVNASMSLFNESRFALEQLKTVQPNPSSTLIANRYEMLRKAFDKSFMMLLDQYESDSADFLTKRITRESYYSTINGLALRSESMAKFIDAVPVPELKAPASIHRSLACGLFAQATSSMLDYLISNSAQSKSNAQTFIEQAKKELQSAVGLDMNRIIITKEEASADQAASEDTTPETQPEN